MRKFLHIVSPRATLGVAMAALLTVGIGAASLSRAGATVTTDKFNLFPNSTFLSCLKGASGTPKATATVVRGSLNDQLTLSLTNFKPGLSFDLFTVQRSSQLANGSPNPTPGFGLAWYQSDVQVSSTGTAKVKINTILLDQIFGFDPDVSLTPTNTFNVGFWFNNPADAAPCGFNVAAPTPFNGEHKAGPLAFITRPSATTGLGPLCTDPNDTTTPPTCNG